MADEPSESVTQATQAHECNGAREGSPCNYSSESGAAIIDGATDIQCSVIEMLHVLLLLSTIYYHRPTSPLLTEVSPRTEAKK